ncbi:hypothetical protein BSZ32_17955 [Rubritalea profundi]|uniref:Uncharacterized protein n=1 Tax=Rubritalea profundi TaxID=1658618 RepID=A0A2S7U581_9BACT|nr:hypothetical protein BSZ32_17955 [Rubritalea profundi]
METAQKLRESRSRNLLHRSDQAVKQLRVFKEVLPITPKNSESSEPSPNKTISSSPKRQQS